VKLLPRQVEAFLARPDPRIRAVLIYGPDAGLVSERALALARAAVPDPNDPFAVSELTGAVLAEEPERLALEAAQATLGAGKRLVRVGGGGDAASPAVERLLAAPATDALVVIAAGDLGSRSSLRRLFEGEDSLAAIACYADDPAMIERLIDQALKAHELRIAPEARADLAARLGADRLQTRGELEKLCLYVGRGRSVSLADVEAAIGDGAAVTPDDVADAACGGDHAALDRAIGHCLRGGEAPLDLLRATARHVQRLHQLRAALDSGQAFESAAARLRPPLFWKRRDATKRQIVAWSAPRLLQALDLLTEAELESKSAGMPVESICARALMRLAQAARAGRAA